jgi:hypothetical protein
MSLARPAWPTQVRVLGLNGRDGQALPNSKAGLVSRDNAQGAFNAILARR